MARRTRTLERPPAISAVKSGADYDARWSRVSKLGLRLQPTCEDCLQAAQCRHHEQPLSCSESRKYQVGWHVSLCNDCHQERHRRGYVSDWEPREDRVVLWGLPGVGKTTMARQLGVEPIWDQDVVAADNGWEPRSLTPSQILTMQTRRNNWVSAIAEVPDQPCVLICVSPHTAYECGRRLCAKMVHVWCHEITRLRRLEKRSCQQTK